jgi:hypothetical protein
MGPHGFPIRLARTGLMLMLLLVAWPPLDAWAGAGSQGGRGAHHQYRASLAAVTTVPGSSVMWAVGYAEKQVGEERTLAYRWNGSVWRQVSTPSPGMDAELTSVAARSPRDVWAVGFFWSSSKVHEPLALHWNGSSWSRVPTPSAHASLRGVAILGAANAWAVGYASTDEGDVPLTLRWTGSAWRRVPCAGIDGTLNAVAGSGARIWAVGRLGDEAFAVRWTGSAWSRSPTPHVLGSELTGVTVAGPTAWAVGNAGASWDPPRKTLILRWNGSRWTKVWSPNPGYDPELHAVDASSPWSVWAVGDTQANSGWRTSVFLHWNGSSWRRVHSPSSYEGNTLRIMGVTAISPTSVVGVGLTEGHYDPAFYAYLCRWNGTGWVYWSS